MDGFPGAGSCRALVDGQPWLYGLMGPVAIAGARVLAGGLDNNLTKKGSLADPLQITEPKGLKAGPVNLSTGLLVGGGLPSLPWVATARGSDFNYVATRNCPAALGNLRLNCDVHAAFNSRSAFSVTSTVAPVSARIAGQRPVMPIIVVTRNTAFNPSEMAMF